MEATDDIRDFAIAPLRTIDYARIKSQDADEIFNLVEAARIHGFFYLDFRGDSQSPILRRKEEIAHVAKQYFDQPYEVKAKDDERVAVKGYKPVGRLTGASEDARDGYETLKFLRDDLLLQPAAVPRISQGHLALFRDFVRLCHETHHTLLSCLTTALEPEESRKIMQSHDDEEPSTTNLTLLHYPVNTPPSHSGLVKHTDVGTLTLLFGDSQWGLQVLMPDTLQWSFIEPRPELGLVNIGDSLRFLSKNQFKSCLHRVQPRRSAVRSRISIAYFLRPRNGTLLTAPDGRRVPIETWNIEKFAILEETHKKQDKGKIATGGMMTVQV